MPSATPKAEPPANASRATTAGASWRSRLLGVDAARGLALIGMMSVHIYPGTNPDGTFTASNLIASGRSSALFAVLAGVGLALLSGGRTPPRGRKWAGLAAAVATRAVLLILVGLVLGALDSGVAVILVYYGMLFVLAIPFLPLGPRVLLPLAVVWAVAAPVLSQALRPALPAATYDNPGGGSGTDLPGMLTELLFTGYYPSVPWLAYVLAGLGLGRLALGSRRTAGTLLVVGTVVAIAAWTISDWLLDDGALARITAAGLGDHPSTLPVGPDVQHTGFFGTTPTTSWSWLTIASPHSGTPFDLFHTIGTSVAVLGLMLLIASVARGLVKPLAAVGSMTFTLYTLHVVLLSSVVPPKSQQAYAVHIIIAFAVAVPWRRYVGRGPLEGLTATLGHGVRDNVESRLGERRESMGP